MVEERAITLADPVGPVTIRRSSRRRKTVSAFREEGRLIIAVPAGLSPEQEREYAWKLGRRLADRAPGRDGPVGDADLQRRAEQLSRTYLQGRARPSSVRWVDNQNRRWGSCTPATGAVRISREVAGLPGWVQDYVLVHELAHLLVADHSPAFWQWVQHYPRSERARGFLDGLSWRAAQLPH